MATEGGKVSPGEEAPAKGTAYLILRWIGEELDVSQPASQWAEVGTATANSKAEAVKKVAGEVGGAYKAVPLRSWHDTIKVEVEEVTRVKVEIV